jgi:hypothetical protein
MTSFQTKENVMKNQGQANNINNLNDPTVANDQDSQVEFEDLPISGEQEEQVKGRGDGRVNVHEIVVTKICDRA